MIANGNRKLEERALFFGCRRVFFSLCFCDGFLSDWATGEKFRLVGKQMCVTVLFGCHIHNQESTMDKNLIPTFLLLLLLLSSVLRVYTRTHAVYLNRKLCFLIDAFIQQFNMWFLDVLLREWDWTKKIVASKRELHRVFRVPILRQLLEMLSFLRCFFLSTEKSVTNSKRMLCTRIRARTIHTLIHFTFCFIYKVIKSNCFFHLLPCCKS